jgi:hypothetical protein
MQPEAQDDQRAEYDKKVLCKHHSGYDGKKEQEQSNIFKRSHISTSIHRIASDSAGSTAI